VEESSKAQGLLARDSRNPRVISDTMIITLYKGQAVCNQIEIGQRLGSKLPACVEGSPSPKPHVKYFNVTQQPSAAQASRLFGRPKPNRADTNQFLICLHPSCHSLWIQQQQQRQSSGLFPAEAPETI